MGPANIIFSFCQYIFQALQIAAIRYSGGSSSARCQAAQNSSRYRQHTGLDCVQQQQQ